MIRPILLGLSVAALTASAALAEQPSQKGGKDPNKMVCRTVDEIGSRLNKSRACHTVAEWAELRRQTRETVQHIQDSRPAHLSN